MKRNEFLYLNIIIGLNVVWTLNKGREVEENYANNFVLDLLIRNDLTYFSHNPRYDSSYLNVNSGQRVYIDLCYN